MMPGRSSLIRTARLMAFAKFLPIVVTTTVTVTSSAAVGGGAAGAYYVMAARPSLFVEILLDDSDP